MVKPEFLVGKNNDNSVHAKPVDLVDMICHALHVKSGDLTSNTNIASVHVKPVDSVGKNNGSALHAKKGNLTRKNNCDVDDLIEEVDWIFQPKSLKKKTPFEAQETKVHNRFSLFEDDEEDNVVKSILEMYEDVKCHGSKNKYKSEEIPVEGKASKENSTKRKRTN